MNLRIVLGHEKLLHTLENSPPKEPPRTETVAWETWKTHHDDDITARCIMLAGMNLKFRRQNKVYDACQIMARLKDLHESSLRVERFEVSKKLFRSRMQEGESVEIHVSDMVNCIDRLASLDLVMDSELSIDLILQSLPDSWSSFIMNYNMLNKERTLGELCKMLRDAEPNINKGKKREVHLGETSRKKRVKTKKPKVSPNDTSRSAQPIQKAQGAPQPGQRVARPDDICMHCGKKGHWRRDCRSYKAELRNKKRGKAPAASASGMFVIEINLSASSYTSWIFDTGCTAHICNNVQGLQVHRSIVSGKVDLRVDNSSSVTVLAVGSYQIALPMGLVLVLSDCYFVPSMTRNMISVSCLAREGFTFVFRNIGCFVYKDDVYYCTVEMSNGLYVLSTYSPTYNVTNKRLKTSDVNKTYLWHCRLGHINETRISTLWKGGSWTALIFIHM